MNSIFTPGTSRRAYPALLHLHLHFSVSLIPPDIIPSASRPLSIDYSPIYNLQVTDYRFQRYNEHLCTHNSLLTITLLFILFLTVSWFNAPASIYSSKLIQANKNDLFFYFRHLFDLSLNFLCLYLCRSIKFSAEIYPGGYQPGIIYFFHNTPLSSCLLRT